MDYKQQPRVLSLPQRAAARPGDRHTSLALYILLRGITLLIRCGNKPDAPLAVRKALAPTRWKHGDTALMCLATSQITYSWIMMPHTLPKSYVKFLNKHGGRQQWHYDAAKVRLYLNNSCHCLSSVLWPGPVSCSTVARHCSSHCWSRMLAAPTKASPHGA